MLAEAVFVAEEDAGAAAEAWGEPRAVFRVRGRGGCWAFGLGGRRSPIVGGRSRASLVGKVGVLATVMLGRWLEVGSRFLPSSDLVEHWAYDRA